jgi:hypothetical protein
LECQKPAQHCCLAINAHFDEMSIDTINNIEHLSINQGMLPITSTVLSMDTTIAFSLSWQAHIIDFNKARQDVARSFQQ